MKWEWYQKPEMVLLFIHFLLLANHEELKWRGLTIKPGQFITGLKSLNHATGLSIQTIRTCISRFLSTGEITNISTNKYRIITLVNYDNYQIVNKKQQANQQANQQTTNKQLTTNKKDKELIRNIYKEYKYFDDYSFKKAYTDFKAMRKSMRNVPFTESAEKTILNKLHKVEIKTAIAMLEESTEKGWRSVFPPKEESDPMKKYNWKPPVDNF